jgi:hypothetical protein
VAARAQAAARPRRDTAPRPAQPPRPRTVPRSRRRRRVRLRVRLGLTIIPLIACLFAGVVWVNSVELRITKHQGQVTRQMTQVQEQLAVLTSQRASWDETVRARAEQELGMIRTRSDDLTFVAARKGR